MKPRRFSKSYIPVSSSREIGVGSGRISSPGYTSIVGTSFKMRTNVLCPNKTRGTRRVQRRSLREAVYPAKIRGENAREGELMRLDKSPRRDCLDRPGKRS